MTESPFVVNPPQPADPKEEPVVEQQKEPVVLCAAAYDEPRRAAEPGGGGGVESHTCSLAEEHEGLHHCDRCGNYWLARVGVTEGSAAAREQVNMARRDARMDGTGFVMVTRVKDAGAQGGWGLGYQRIPPERVTLRVEKPTNGNGGGGGS